MATKKTYRRWTAKFVHYSGRFDRADSLFRRSLLWVQNSMPGVSVVTGTEAKGRPTRLMKSKGWDVAHGDAQGFPGDSKECWITWKTRVWDLVGFEQVTLSALTYTRSKEYGGGKTPPFKAAKATLRHIKSGQDFVFFVVHMPLDNTSVRALVWRACADGLGDAVLDVRSADAVVIQGDINKNWREPGDRAECIQCVEQDGDVKCAWRDNVPAKGGTHGPRGLIDHTYVDGTLTVVYCRLISVNRLLRRASDHYPYKVKVAWRR